MQVAGFFAALAAVLYTTVTSSSESASFSIGAVQHDAVELPYRPDFFHSVFMLASAYLVRKGSQLKDQTVLRVARGMSACDEEKGHLTEKADCMCCSQQL